MQIFTDLYPHNPAKTGRKTSSSRIAMATDRVEVKIKAEVAIEAATKDRDWLRTVHS
jgi:hypothetical protein